VERVFELEEQLEKMRTRMERLERQARRMEQEMIAEVDRIRRSYKHELVKYEPPGQALAPAAAQAVRIRVHRAGR